jgi:hypothetical protein
MNLGGEEILFISILVHHMVVYAEAAVVVGHLFVCVCVYPLPKPLPHTHEHTQTHTHT